MIDKTCFSKIAVCFLNVIRDICWNLEQNLHFELFYSIIYTIMEYKDVITDDIAMRLLLKMRIDHKI